MIEPIESAQELPVVARQLRTLEATLESLEQELSEANPELLAMTRGAYEARIAHLRRAIADYLYEHPEGLRFFTALLSGSPVSDEPLVAA